MTQSFRVLLVEDEGLIAANLEMILEDAGHVIVGWATDSAEARAIALSAAPDLAIVDVQLRNGDDGITLAEELQQRFGTRIIFVTAQGDPRTVARAKAVPHSAYVPKPYSRSSILAALPRS